MEEEEAEQPDCMESCEEDDILYAGGAEMSVDDATTLLFIHQSEQQLEILKRCQKQMLNSR